MRCLGFYFKSSCDRTNSAGIGTPGCIVGPKGPLDIEIFARVVKINLTGIPSVMRLSTAGIITVSSSVSYERGIMINTVSAIANGADQAGGILDF